MNKLSKAMAFALILTISASFAACNTNPDSNKTTEPITQNETVTVSQTNPLEPDSTSPSASSSSTMPGTSKTPAPTADPLVGTNKAKIVAYYNKAIDFTNRNGTVKGSSQMDLSDVMLYGKPSSLLTNIAKGAMKASFKSEKFTKLPPKYLTASSIRVSDVAKASCTKNGDTYVIKLTAITEQNAHSQNSAHGRMFNVDDSLTTNITNNLNFYGDEQKDIQKTYRNSQITAVVNIKTGKIVKLTSDLNTDLFIRNFKILGITVDSRGASCKLNVHEDYTVS